MNYADWLRSQQQQLGSPMLSANNLGAFSSMGNYMQQPQAPEMFSNAPAAMDWTKGASANIGKGGFTGAGLAPKSMWDGFGANSILDGLKSGVGAYLAYGQLKNAKQSLAFQKDAFSKNFAMQGATLGRSMQDRIDSRNNSTTQAGYRSPKDYMAGFNKAMG